MGIIETLRQFRIGPFTIFDTATAFLGIFLIAPFLTKLFLLVHVYIPRSAWLWFTIPIGEIFHLIIRQETPVMKMLTNPNGDYIAKIALLVLILVGLSQIRIQR